EIGQRTANTSDYYDRETYTLATARLAAATGEWDTATTALAENGAILGRLGMRWYQARYLLEWAAVLRARGAPGDAGAARTRLEEAASLFKAIGVPYYKTLVTQQIADLS